MMHISIVNRSRKVADLEVHQVVRAINRQIAEDFEPYWHFGARLRLEGPGGGRLDTAALAEMRGDAVIYLVDSVESNDAFGYHDDNLRGIPYGFVFLDLCAQMGDPWSSTLSHEALELVGDPMANLLVEGPSPKDRRHKVFHYFEMCDAVQDQSYVVDGVTVSNFVLPAFFATTGSAASRRDFLGSDLASFSITSGGYLGYYDPASRSAETFMPDERARQRYRVKNAVGQAFGERVVTRITRRAEQSRAASSPAPSGHAVTAG